MTDLCEKCTKVMNAAEENTTNQNPDNDRNPAEHGRADWAGDRACSCDRLEMVAHQHRRFRRYIVNTVFHLVRRRLVLAVANTPLFAKPSAVEYVTEDENCNTDD